VADTVPARPRPATGGRRRWPAETAGVVAVQAGTLDDRSDVRPPSAPTCREAAQTYYVAS